MARKQPKPLILEHLEQRLAMTATLSLLGPADVVYEGERAEFTLTLSQPSKVAERVFVSTAPGTATYGTDYFAPPSTQILFSPGQTQQRFSVSVLREPGNRVEGVETFQVIARPVNAALGVRSSTVRIADWIPPPPVSINDVTVMEGNRGTTAATFTISLSAAWNLPLTVNYATRDGSATVANNDYTPTSGALTFAPGETSKTVSVSVIGDNALERDETFSLVLSSSGSVTFRRGTGTAIIQSDEIDRPGFQITMDYDASVPSNIRTLFDQAKARWERVITGDLPGVQWNGQFIDDILIYADVAPLDPGTIAQAGFDDIRRGFTSTPANGNGAQSGLPYLASMTINTSFVSAVGIGNTIAHEMGHALGFATLWGNNVGTFPSLVAGIGTANPVFRGANATREYNKTFGTAGTSVPLFDNYGIPPFGYDGSYGGHWRDSTFNNNAPSVPLAERYYELMTAQYNVLASLPNGQPIPSYLSRITVGAMQDLGYQVNYGAADAYTAPAFASLASISSLSQRTAASTRTQATIAIAMQQEFATANAPTRDAGTTSGRPSVSRGITVRR